MFKLILTAFLALSCIASELNLNSGFIQAHTEVFGDSNINPSTNKINSRLTMNDTIESIQGIIAIESFDLKSDNSKRDTNMYALLNASVHPSISFEFSSITLKEKEATIEGFLTLNGMKKPIVSTSTITETDNKINLFGNFSILLSDYGMTPPSMFFLTVRNQIDIMYNLHYTKK
jgi:polyisoprenoid-binding protein YceI